MYILKWDNYLFESIINESKLYFSKDLRDKLFLINNSISKDLLSKEFTDIKPDTTFLKLEDDGYISYIRLKEAEKLMDPKWRFKSFDDLDVQELNDISDSRIGIFSGDKRNKIKIGRLINSIFPQKYSPKEIEEFTNIIKSNIQMDTEKFELVDGDEISFWYNGNNYLNLSGTLGSSCMRYERCSDYFDIYTKNPEVCKLLILKNIETDKIIGRSLIWKIKIMSDQGSDLGIEYLMDRIYYNNDIIVDKFRNYAISKNWACKTHNNFSSNNNITYKNTSYYVNMKVQLKEEKYEKFPYMDTFKGFNKENFYLENISNKSIGYLFLEGQDGDYEDGDNNSVYSEWYDTEIEEDDAIWSDIMNDYLILNRAIRVNIGTKRGWYPEDFSELSYDNFRNEYIHINNSEYSSYYDEDIFDEDAIDGITNININNGKINLDIDIVSSYDHNIYSSYQLDKSSWYKKMTVEYPEIEDYSIASSILNIDYKKENYILNIGDISIKTYQYKNGWFLKIDAFLLKNNNFDKNSNQRRPEDKFDYLDRVKKYNIKNICEKELNRIENILTGKQVLLNIVGDIDDYKSELSSLKLEIEKRLDFENNLINNFRYD